MRRDIRKAHGLLPPEAGRVSTRDVAWNSAPADRIKSLEQPLSYDFPTFGRVPFGFTGLDVPFGLGIPVTDAAWFGLTSINVEEDTGQEVYWTGYTLEQSPGDTAGTGDVNRYVAGNFIAWGELAGCPSSYIVIGPKLPMVLNAWTNGPVLFPGLNVPAAGNGKQIQFAGMDDVQAFSTPLGNVNAAGSGRRFLIENTTPMALRLSQGSRLDVAFVCTAATANSAPPANAVLFGFAYGHVKLGRRIAGASFTP